MTSRMRVAGAAVLAAGLAWSAAFAGDRPPVEAFGTLPQISEPELSPDGKHLAVIQTFKGRPVVVIYPVNAPPGTQPAIVKSDDWLVDNIAWAKNDRLIIAVKVSKKLSDDSKHLMRTWERAVSVDAQGQNAVVLLKDNVYLDNNVSAVTIADRDIADPDFIYMPIYVYSDTRTDDQAIAAASRGGADDDQFRYNLYRVNVRTGGGEQVEAGTTNTDHWYMDGNGHIIARNDQSERPLKDHVKLYDKGDWKDGGTYDASADKGNGLIGLTEDGTALVQAGWNDASMSVLSRLPLGSGDPSALFADPHYDIDTTLIDEWSGRVIGAVYTDDRPQYVYFDPKYEALQKGLEAAFPGLSVHAVSMNLAQTVAVVEVEGPQQPTAYYLVDRTSHTATLIESAYPGLKAADLGEMKPYSYKARDGLDIPAYLTLPPGRPAKNLPAIVMPHGGPDARDAIGFDWWAQFLANRGYVVLQPNYRGSSGYGHKFTEAGLHQWGLKMQDDISDGVKKMIADGIADPKRICIVGGSYGGYAALAGATLTPDLYACAASFAGISDLPAILRSDRTRYGQNSSEVSFWASRIGGLYDDSDELRAVSPDRHADAVKCPILLMHGEGDTTVPIEQSDLMNEALKRAGKSVTYIKFEGEDHYLSLADTRIKMLTALESFLAKSIGAESGPSN